MPKTVLCPKNLKFQPRSTYPYSPGAKGGQMVFTAGQVAWDKTGEVTAIGDVRAQTVQTLTNVKSVLEEGGATLDDVFKCNVYLADMRHFQIMNEEFAPAAYRGGAGPASRPDAPCATIAGDWGAPSGDSRLRGVAADWRIGVAT